MSKVQELLVKETSSLRDAIAAIDKNAEGICYAVDDQQRLKGVLTDGDVRRALLKGLTLANRVVDAMNTDFVALSVASEEKQIQASFNAKISHIPIVDSDNRVVEFASRSHSHRIPILQPELSGNELEYVTECVTTNWISSQGRFVSEFERVFSELHDDRFALAVSNGTVALHLALVALGIGAGDEVIVPNLTFAACLNSVLYTGASPVLVDVASDTWTMDLARLDAAITPRTRAIMPVHLYGHPCDMNRIMELANGLGIHVVEDSAEALGSRYRDHRVGTFGDAATFSFFGNKTITTGEGGMILFRDKAIAEQARVLRDHGMSKEKRYWHQQVGFNYRLTNLQAAVGVAQMERLDEFVTAKRLISSRYSDAFRDMSEIMLPTEKDWAFHSYWLFTMLLDSEEQRDKLIKKLEQKGVDSRPVFYPMHQMPPYQEFGANVDLSISTDISRRGISLPSSSSLTEQEISHVIDAVQSAVRSRSISDSS